MTTMPLRVRSRTPGKFQEVSSELYKKASAQAGPQRGPSEGPTAGAEGEKKDSDVADAEFEMVDEDKKKN
jgi:hypothetical protein